MEIWFDENVSTDRFFVLQAVEVDDSYPEKYFLEAHGPENKTREFTDRIMRISAMGHLILGLEQLVCGSLSRFGSGITFWQGVVPVSDNILSRSIRCFCKRPILHSAIAVSVASGLGYLAFMFFEKLAPAKKISKTENKNELDNELNYKK
ncbi:MAG: hypothetical protein CfP315_0789 [Candidatus Improbicoccus pseudotrichonymphae]|uniref:Uncharacterized protein n=1 Tax=Candidatus Improbicoccus pseudotrichonymphae TaxID=3033792 RepID=A0AA48KZD6_9FIRM|nr:MAG: hypothetical protein CfP315_0789 [Candidatus Improbicoccus pseudotrichonymphae]